MSWEDIEDGKRINCPGCGRFLTMEDINTGYECDNYEIIIYCANKVCTWKDEIEDNTF